MNRLSALCFALSLSLCLISSLGHAQSANGTTSESPSSASESTSAGSETLDEQQREVLEEQIHQTKISRVWAGVGTGLGLGLTGVGVWGTVWTVNQLAQGTGGDGLAYVSGLIIAFGTIVIAGVGAAITTGGVVGLIQTSWRIDELEEKLERQPVSLSGGLGPNGHWSVGLRFRF